MGELGKKLDDIEVDERRNWMSRRGVEEGWQWMKERLRSWMKDEIRKKMDDVKR